jgi:glutamate synthase domain-containing protein 3
MTGGRAYLYDPDGRHVAALDARSVNAVRLSAASREREDGATHVDEFRRLVQDHREAGSALAGRLLAERHDLESDVWLVEPVAVPTPLARVVLVDDRHPVPEARSTPRTAAV